MKRTRITAILLVLVLSAGMFALAGCGGDQGTGGDTSWTDVEAAGVLRVGTEGAWAPFIFNDMNDNNKLVGFEVEWAEAVAEKLGLEVEWNVSSQWDGVVAGLDADRYECIFCAVALTEYASDKYSFSRPYYLMKTVLVTAADNDTIKSLDDLDGKLCGNSPQGVWGQIAEAHGAEVRNMNLSQSMDNLKTGRIDATLNAELAILDYMKTSGDKGVKIAAYYQPEDPNEEKIVVLFQKDKNELIEKVNGAIAEVIDDGTAAELSIKYFGKDIYEGVDFGD